MNDAPALFEGRRETGRDLCAHVAPWLAAAAVAIPVLAFRYPPMFDLPCHEEIVGAMRHAGDARFYPPGLMEWNVGHANQLFYFLAMALAYVVPVDVACKIVVAASVAATPLAAARLADHVGTTRWAAVAVAPLALGFAFTFGFVGSMVGLPLFLASLPEIDRFVHEPDARRTLRLMAIFALLYEAHEVALFFAFVAVAVLSVVRRLDLKGAIVRLLPLLIAGLGLTVEHGATLRHRGPNLATLAPVIDLAGWQKRAQLPECLLGRHGQTATIPVFLVFFAVSGLIFVDRLRARRWVLTLRVEARDVRPWAYAHRFALLGGVLVGAYFVVPFSVTGAMWLHARFLAPGAALLVVSLAPSANVRCWLATRVASFVPLLAQLTLLWPEFVATAAVYRDLDPLLAQVDPGSAVAHVDLVGGPLPGRVFSVGGAAARVGAARGGRMAASFTQTTPLPPVVIATAHRWDSALQRATSPGGLQPSVDLHRFRYVLAWVWPAQVDALTRAMAPEARLLGASGGWLLFESTVAVASPMSAPPPDVDAPTVGDRLRARSAPSP